MLASSKVTLKNQTTLPKIVLDTLGLKPSDRIFYEIEDGRVVLHAKTEPLSNLRGKFRDFGRKSVYPVSIEDMHQAAAEAVAEKAARYSAGRKSARRVKAKMK